MDLNGEVKVGEVSIRIPVSKTKEEFKIIEKINSVLDERAGRRTEVTSWNVDG